MSSTPQAQSVTAVVGTPTPVPPRPTLYAVLYPEGNSGTSWAIGSVWSTQERGELQQSCVLGSILVTIPGSHPPSPEANPDHIAEVGKMVSPDVPSWVPYCCHPGCMARVLNNGDKCSRHLPQPVDAGLRKEAMLARELFDKHDLWCGHNPNAPGDSVIGRYRDVRALNGENHSEASTVCPHCPQCASLTSERDILKARAERAERGLRLIAIRGSYTAEVASTHLNLAPKETQA